MHLAANITHSSRPSRGTPLARLLLALLLACVPVLSAAQPLLMGHPGDGAVEQIGGVAQMPCHAEADIAPEAPPHACPHCAGDAPAGHCECCDQAAPSGVTSRLLNTDRRPGAGDRYHATLPDALPPSPADRLYRPPIVSS